MWNHAYLVILYNKYCGELKKYTDVVYDDVTDSLLATNKNNQSLTKIPLEAISEEMSTKIFKSYNYLGLYFHLLEEQPFEDTYEYWTFAYVLKKAIEPQIKSCFLREGIAVGHYKGLPVSIDTNTSELFNDYQRLTTLEALQEGYCFREIKGSHFEIHCGKEKEATSYNHCTCDNFHRDKDCVHLSMAQTLLNHRY